MGFDFVTCGPKIPSLDNLVARGTTKKQIRRWDSATRWVELGCFVLMGIFFYVGLEVRATRAAVVGAVGERVEKAFLRSGEWTKHGSSVESSRRAVRKRRVSSSTGGRSAGSGLPEAEFPGGHGGELIHQPAHDDLPRSGSDTRGALAESLAAFVDGEDGAERTATRDEEVENRPREEHPRSLYTEEDSIWETPRQKVLDDVRTRLDLVEYLREGFFRGVEAAGFGTTGLLQLGHIYAPRRPGGIERPTRWCARWTRNHLQQTARTKKRFSQKDRFPLLGPFEL